MSDEEARNKESSKDEIQDKQPKKPKTVTKELTKINKDIKDKLTTINEDIKDELNNIHREIEGELKKIDGIERKLNKIDTEGILNKLGVIEEKLNKLDPIEGKLNKLDRIENISRSNDDVNSDDYVEKKRNLLLAWNIVLMIAASLLIVSGKRIDTSQLCPLETALKYIFRENVPYPCKYTAIKEHSVALWGSGITVLCLEAILFGIIISFPYICMEKKEVLKIVLKIVVIVASVLGIIGMAFVLSYFVIWKEDEQSNISYTELQSSMISELENNYVSDVTNGSNEISNGWNKLFIDYDCCAVRTVEGTTNDFDTTPWCTTSGSCQATSSQIPKTCCKDVTSTNYHSAPNDCHASVNPGTFKSSCISRMKELSTESIPGYQIIITFVFGFVIIVGQAVFLFIIGQSFCSVKKTVSPS